MSQIPYSSYLPGMSLSPPNLGPAPPPYRPPPFHPGTPEPLQPLNMNPIYPGFGPGIPSMQAPLPTPPPPPNQGWPTVQIGAPGRSFYDFSRGVANVLNSQLGAQNGISRWGSTPSLGLAQPFMQQIPGAIPHLGGYPGWGIGMGSSIGSLLGGGPRYGGMPDGPAYLLNRSGWSSDPRPWSQAPWL